MVVYLVRSIVFILVVCVVFSVSIQINAIFIISGLVLSFCCLLFPIGAFVARSLDTSSSSLSTAANGTGRRQPSN